MAQPVRLSVGGMECVFLGSKILGRTSWLPRDAARLLRASREASLAWHRSQNVAEFRRPGRAHPSVHQRRNRRLRGSVSPDESMRGIADCYFAEVHMGRETSDWQHNDHV